MDILTFLMAIGFMKAMPDTAARSAAQAIEAAEAAQEAADSVTSATVAETKAYLGID